MNNNPVILNISFDEDLVVIDWLLPDEQGESARFAHTAQILLDTPEKQKTAYALSQYASILIEDGKEANHPPVESFVYGETME